MSGNRGRWSLSGAEAARCPQREMLSPGGQESKGHSLAARGPPGPHPEACAPRPCGGGGRGKGQGALGFERLRGSLPALLMSFAWASFRNLSFELRYVKREAFRQTVPCGRHRGNPRPQHRGQGGGRGGCLHRNAARPRVPQTQPCSTGSVMRFGRIWWHLPPCPQRLCSWGDTRL